MYRISPPRLLFRESHLLWFKPAQQQEISHQFTLKYIQLAVKLLQRSKFLERGHHFNWPDEYSLEKRFDNTSVRKDGGSAFIINQRHVINFGWELPWEFLVSAKYHICLATYYYNYHYYRSLIKRTHSFLTDLRRTSLLQMKENRLLDHLFLVSRTDASWTSKCRYSTFTYVKIFYHVT